MWHKIPGFPRYEISDGLQVRKAESFQILKRDFHSVYLAKDGIRYGFTVQELLRAALAGVEPKHKYAKRKYGQVKERREIFHSVPCPQTEALLSKWTGNPLMSGLDAADCCVGY